MQRPLGVTILAVLIFLYGLLMTGLNLFGLVLILLSTSGKLPAEWTVGGERLSAIDVLQIAAQITLGVFALLSSIGMLRLLPWAWLMAMLLLGCNLAIQLGDYLQGHPIYLVMFITALLVLYLNQRLIREAFGIEPKSSAVSAGMPIEPTIRAGAVEPPGAQEQ